MEGEQLCANEILTPQRRRNSPGLSSSPEPAKRSYDDDPVRQARILRDTAPPSADTDMKGVMDMEYTRRGGVREWDVGK